MAERKCTNCSVELGEDDAVTELLLSDDTSEDGDSKVEGNGQGMSLKDTLSSIFGPIVATGDSVNKSGGFSMCYRCAEALITLYQAFLDFIHLSEIDSAICDLISQVKNWHQQKTESLIGSHFLHSNEAQTGARRTAGINGVAYEQCMEELVDVNSRRRSIRITISGPATSSSSTVVTGKPIYTKKRALDDSGLQLQSRRSTKNGRNVIPDQNLDEIISNSSMDSGDVGVGSEQVENIKKIAPVSKKGARPRGRPRKSKQKALIPIKKKAKEKKLKRGDDTTEVKKKSKIPRTLKTRNRNPQQRAPCHLCSKKFQFFWMLNIHVLKDHENKIPTKCKRCKFECFDIERGKSHICKPEAKDKLLTCRCEYCGERFPKSLILKHGYRHERDASGFKCQEQGCGKTFLCQASLTSHTDKFHTEGALERRKERLKRQCDECGKVLHDKRSLADHMHTHTDECKFLCTICGLAFKQDRGLRRHMQLGHFAARKYQCPLCRLGFKTGYYLRKHFKCKVHQPEEVAELLKKSAQEFIAKGEVIIPTKNRFKNHSAWAGKKKNARAVKEATGSSSEDSGRNAHEEQDMQRLIPIPIPAPSVGMPSTVDTSNLFHSSSRLQDYSIPSFYSPFLR